MTKSEATAILQRTSTALGVSFRLQQALSQFFSTQEEYKLFWEKHGIALDSAVIEIRDMAAADIK